MKNVTCPRALSYSRLLSVKYNNVGGRKRRQKGASGLSLWTLHNVDRLSLTVECKNIVFFTTNCILWHIARYHKDKKR